MWSSVPTNKKYPWFAVKLPALTCLLAVTLWGYQKPRDGPVSLKMKLKTDVQHSDHYSWHELTSDSCSMRDWHKAIGMEWKSCVYVRKWVRKVTGGIPCELRPLQAHSRFLCSFWGAKVQIVQGVKGFVEYLLTCSELSLASSQLFLLKLSNSIYATSFINMWWEGKSPKAQ